MTMPLHFHKPFETTQLSHTETILFWVSFSILALDLILWFFSIILEKNTKKPIKDTELAAAILEEIIKAIKKLPRAQQNVLKQWMIGFQEEEKIIFWICQKDGIVNYSNFYDNDALKKSRYCYQCGSFVNSDLHTICIDRNGNGTKII